MLPIVIIASAVVVHGETSNPGTVDDATSFHSVLGHGASSQAWFYPDESSERALITADGRLGGLPVQRTGDIVVRTDDPGALATLPWVAEVEGLGHGDTIFRVRTQPGTDEFARSRQLRGAPGVHWAHPDLAFEPVLHSLPNDPYVADQWHLHNTGQGGWTEGVDIDAQTAWAIATGVGGLIAVIDTGVDVDHPDLDATSGWDYIGDDDDSFPDPEYDGYPHGTCAAGVAAATGGNGVGVAGVAYDAQVYGVRFIGGSTTYGDLYDAFVESVDAGAWVLSNSWGFGSGCPSFSIPATVRSALEYAEEQGRGGLGTAVVTSAGNGNCDASGDGFQAFWTIIGVAAVNGDDERESYSSYGSIVDIAAPSGGLLTTDVSGEDGYGDYNGDPDYIGWFSGTSAAAPVVSGVLTLMFEANPRLSAAQAREVLCDTAIRIDLDTYQTDEQGWNAYYGCGRVDAGAAVLAVANTAPPAPDLLGPDREAYLDSVVLSWSPADDDDGDWLDYRVSWWVDEDAAGTLTQTTSATSLDITDQVAPGDVVSWQVVPSDLWGTGEASETGHFEVLAIPAPPEPDGSGACSSSGRTRGLGALLLGLGLVALRRRSMPGRGLRAGRTA
jgi:subtilisin family serine protease